MEGMFLHEEQRFEHKLQSFFESNPINLHILIIKEKKFMRFVPECDIMV